MSADRGRLSRIATTAWGAARGMWASAYSSRLAAGLRGGGCAVLRYHSVNDDPEWARDYVSQSIVVRPRQFDEQLTYLGERYTVVPLSHVVRAITSGSMPDPRWVAITFDDGYEDNYRFAYRLLRKHNMPATFYVTTDCVADAEVLWTVRLRFAVMTTTHTEILCPSITSAPIGLSSPVARECAVRFLTGLVKHCSRTEANDVLAEIMDACLPGCEPMSHRVMMTPDELREMEQNGMTIGAHSVHHYNLPLLEDGELTDELSGAKSFLEDEIGLCVEHFAYPNGRKDRHCDARVATEVARCGYLSASTSISGPAGPAHSPFGIPRVGVSARRTDMRSFGANLQHGRLTRPRSPSLADIERNGPRRGVAREETGR